MYFSIGNLAGIFNGDVFNEGPIRIEIDDGRISSIDSTDRRGDIDGTGKLVSIPFCDGHTHLIFAGHRFNELSMKLQGRSYSQILESGGGIQSTVKATRGASNKELKELVHQRLDLMLRHGTTVVEAKSGYGLATDHEIRLLKILNDVNKSHPVEIVPTFGGPHVIPQGVDRREYVNEIVTSMLPQIKKYDLATSTDVFCDRGAFTVEETREIMTKSVALDIPVRVHAEELKYTGIAKIAATEFNALSADHLLNARKDDFRVLAGAGTVAMFMPLAPLGLFSTTYPRGFSNTGVTIGLGSDFNPNNWALSMQTALRMAVFTYRMNPIESIRAATTGSYLGIKGENRSLLDEGAPADFVLFDVASPAELVATIGYNAVNSVYLKGKDVLAQI